MLLAIDQAFKDAPVKKKIAQKLYSMGISIREGKLWINGFQIPVKKVSDALGIDRKTMYSFISRVEKDFVLREIFSRLEPKPSLAEIAPILGYEVAKFEASFVDYFKVLDYLMDKVNFLSTSFDQGICQIIYEPGTSKSDIKFLSGFVKNLHVITPDLRKREMVCESCKVEFCPRRKRYA